MARLLLIVLCTEPARYMYLKHVFGNEAVDVMFDRRVGQRRQRQEPARSDRRGPDRRQHDIAKDLQAYGWAVVRHWETQDGRGLEGASTTAAGTAPRASA